jgi:hypothetical protein
VLADAQFRQAKIPIVDLVRVIESESTSGVREALYQPQRRDALRLSSLNILPYPVKMIFWAETTVSILITIKKAKPWITALPIN